ncbi:MAG: autotransporter-associated beta strand repeat-containing protein [Akkermansiaceae bacterium]
MKPKYSRFSTQSNFLNIASPRIVVACLAASAVHFASSAHAADGTYTSQTGAWNLGTSWLDGIPADGADSTAFFTNDVTNSDRTTSLGGNRIIGNITFTDGDIATPFNRVISNNTLTLDVTTGSPLIDVTQSGRSLRIVSVLAGNDGLTKTGLGTLILNNNGSNPSISTLSGQFQILQGIVQYGNANIGGGSTGAHTVAISSGASLRFRHGGADVVTHNPDISGDGSVHFIFNNSSLGGSLTLGGNNSFSGGLTINPSSGTNVLPLVAGSSNAFGSGNVTIGQYGKLDLNGFSNTTGMLVSTGTNGVVTNDGTAPATLTLSSSSATPRSFGGIIEDGAGAVSIVKSGSSSQTFTGLNTYSGSTTVSAGTLSITNDDTLSDTRAVNLATGAILNLNFTGTDTVGALSIDGVAVAAGVYGRTGSIIDLGAQFESDRITGDGLLDNLNANEALTHYWDATGTSWSAAASWTIDPANPAANPPAAPAATSVPIFGANGVTDDTVELGGNQTASGLFFVSPAIFTLTGGGISSDLNLGQSGILVGGAASGAVIGSVAANQDVDVILAASQTWTNSNAAASVTVVNALNASGNSLTLGGAGTFTIGGPATGIGSLTLAGPGGSTFNSPVTGNDVLSLAGTGSSTFLGSVNGFASIVGTGTGDFFFSGPVTGTSSISKKGTGNISFTGTSTSTGDITLDNGALTFSGIGSAVTTGNILLRGYGDTGAVFGTAPTTVNFDAGTIITFSSDKSIQLGNTTFSGGFSLQTLNGNGTLTHDGSLFAGRAGRLNVGGTWTQIGPATIASQGGGSAALTVTTGGQFTYTSATNFLLSTSTSINTVTRFTIDGGVATTGINFHNAQATVSSGASADIVLTNGGTLRLSANVTDLFTTAGATNRVQLDTGGGTVDTNGFSTTLNVPVFGTGGITKAGVGTLTLAETNTYSGNTTVSAGTLELSQDNISNDTSTVSIASNAFLFIADGVVETVDKLFINGVQQAADDYTSANSGGRITGTGTLRVNSDPLAPGFGSWIDDFDLAQSDQDPTDDPDKDGMDNLLEFVLNGNPSVADNAILPKLAVTTNDFEFTYQRRIDSISPETTQIFQWGTTLATWPGSAVIPAASGPVAPATVTVTAGVPSPAVTDTVKVSIPKSEAGASGKLFGRLQVVKP